MSSCSEHVKTLKEKAEKQFFGESIQHVTNQYIKFDHVIDDDTIIINTNNVIMVKGSPVLVVANNKGVYLKDWQVRRMHNFYQGIDLYCVKINRSFFKPYTFRTDFEDISIEGEDTFDSLKQIAATQNEMALAYGFMK